MKVWNYLIIFLAMMLFLEFIGIHTTLNGMLNIVGVDISPIDSSVNSADIKQSDFWSNLFGVGTGVLMLVVTVGGIIAGLFGKAFDTKLLVLPFITGTMLLFAGTGWIIIQQAMLTGEQWIIALIVTIWIPVIAGFIYSLMEFIGGTD